MMANQDLKKIVSHIDETQNWLNKARENYMEENVVRGDMNLNLAQAEIKYTRELTREEDVNNGMKHLKGTAKATALSRQSWSIAAALLLVVILPLTAKMFFSSQQPKMATRNIVDERDNDVFAQTETVPGLQKTPEKLAETDTNSIDVLMVSTKKVSDSAERGTSDSNRKSIETSVAVEDNPLVIEEVKKYEDVQAVTVEKPVEPKSLVTFDEAELLNAAKQSLQYGER